MPDGWLGENLLIKVIDTLEKGIGAYAKPWQTIRDATARTEARRKEILILAQAEKESEEIRAGTKAVDNNGDIIALPAPADNSSELQLMTDENPSNDIFGFMQSYERQKLVLGLKRSINLRKIGVFAQEEADYSKEEEVSDEPVDPDWFARWRNLAQDVSKEEMQRLWGRVLTGEVRKPATFSIHSLDFLSRMNVDDANLLYKLAPLVFNEAIFKIMEEPMKKQCITFEDFIYLDDLGILSGTSGTLEKNTIL